MKFLSFVCFSILAISACTDPVFGQAKKKVPIKKRVVTKKPAVAPNSGTVPTVYPRVLTVAAGYQAVLDEPSRIVLPRGFSEGRKYPLVVFLPWTGGEAANNYNLYAPGFGRLEPFISMVTPGDITSNDWTSQGLAAAVSRYENRILQDLEELKQRQIVDTSRVVLVGFSMGGDLSWAIVQRNPGTFRGAIISGSRTSWSENNGMAQIKSNNAKFYFVMGTEENADRLGGLKYTMGLLDKNQIPYRYERIPGPHVWPTFEYFMEGLEFLLN